MACSGESEPEQFLGGGGGEGRPQGRGGPRACGGPRGCGSGTASLCGAGALPAREAPVCVLGPRGVVFPG